MNHTTPRAADDIAVLRARQLTATKRRVLAELRALKITKATVQYRADPNASGEVEIKGSNGEDANGSAIVLEHPIDAAFHDIATLVERFALDLVAHEHGGFECDGGGYGYVSFHVAESDIQIDHTSIETNAVSTSSTF